MGWQKDGGSWIEGRWVDHWSLDGSECAPWQDPQWFDPNRLHSRIQRARIKEARIKESDDLSNGDVVFWDSFPDSRPERSSYRVRTPAWLRPQPKLKARKPRKIRWVEPPPPPIEEFHISWPDTPLADIVTAFSGWHDDTYRLMLDPDLLLPEEAEMLSCWTHV